jgi:hypothetical protein
MATRTASKTNDSRNTPGSPSPAQSEPDFEIPAALAGVLFMGDAPEVQSKDGNRKGKTPNPMDPTVVNVLNTFLAAKQAKSKKVFKARFEGTNFTFRSVLKGTVDKWKAQQEKKGIIVKVHYSTIEGNVSPAKENNDKKVVIGYSLELVEA